MHNAPCHGALLRYVLMVQLAVRLLFKKLEQLNPIQVSDAAIVLPLVT